MCSSTSPKESSANPTIKELLLLKHQGEHNEAVCPFCNHMSAQAMFGCTLGPTAAASTSYSSKSYYWYMYFASTPNAYGYGDIMEDLDPMSTHSSCGVGGRDWDPYKKYNDQIAQSYAVPYICLKCHKKFPDRRNAWGQPDRGVCFCSWKCWQQDLGNPDAFREEK